VVGSGFWCSFSADEVGVSDDPKFKECKTSVRARLGGFSSWNDTGLLVGVSGFRDALRLGKLLGVVMVNRGSKAVCFANRPKRHFAQKECFK
jgi:hypothetical protein